MLLIEVFELDSCEVMVALTSFADSTLVDIFAIARMCVGNSGAIRCVSESSWSLFEQPQNAR